MRHTIRRGSSLQGECPQRNRRVCTCLDEAEAASVTFRTVRALVKFAPGPGNVAVQEVPAPELSPGKVLIDVHAVAICGTDRSAIAGGHDMKVPRTLGHEVAGTIARHRLRRHRAPGRRRPRDGRDRRLPLRELRVLPQGRVQPLPLPARDRHHGRRRSGRPARHARRDGAQAARGAVDGRRVAQRAAGGVRARRDRAEPAAGGRGGRGDRARRDRAAVRPGGARGGRDGRPRRAQPARGPAGAGAPARRRPHRRLRDGGRRGRRQVADRRLRRPQRLRVQRRRGHPGERPPAAAQGRADRARSRSSTPRRRSTSTS